MLKNLSVKSKILFNSKPMYHFKVLSIHSDDSHPSILMTFDDQQYLFNCGEATQRVCFSSKQSLSKINHVFLSSMHLSNCAGLAGTMITLRDPNSEAMSRLVGWHGPNGLQNIKQQLKMFAPRIMKNIFLNTIDSSSECFSDKNIRVNAVVTIPETVGPRLRPVVSGKKRNRNKHLKESLPIIQYILHTSFRRGKFDPKKALQLGVKAGPDFGLLTSGQSIILDNGTVVTPDQVMEPGKPGLSWMILYCPSKAYLKSMRNCSKLSMYQTNHTSPKCIFHIVGEGLSLESEFTIFLNKFPSDTKHFVFDRATSGNQRNFVSFDSSLTGTNALVYPRLDRQVALEPFDYSQTNWYCAKPQAIIKGEPNFSILMPPTVSGPLSISRQHQVKTIFEDIVVIPLGTASALPGKHRNVSSTLISLPSNDYYLLDVGEGTLGQITRLVGAKEAHLLIARLRCIFISHSHADHHFGLLSILEKWFSVNESGVIYIICPDDVWKFVQDCGPECLLDGNRIHWIDAVKMDIPPDLLLSLSLNSIQTVAVDHINDSRAVIFNHKSYGRVVYSGDCRPSDDLAKLGKDCELLIHECTFEDSLRKEALLKKHCTFSEAIAVAKKMNARNVLLTHFSQRYPKTIEFAQSNDRMNVVLASDHMVLPLNLFNRVQREQKQYKHKLSMDELI